MPWSEDEVREIIQHFDSTPLLWLLIMHRGDQETGIHVGTGKARNAVKVYGKVQAYAKKHGMTPPPDEKEIKNGYTRLLRVPITHPELGKETVIKGGKIDYLKLNSVGHRLVTRIHTEEDLKELAKIEAGLDVDAEPEPKWPDEYDKESATVELRPTQLVSDLDQPFELPTHATFTCEICSNSISHEYTFEYPTEAWSEFVATECEACGTRFHHKVGDPYSTIERLEE